MKPDIVRKALDELEVVFLSIEMPVGSLLKIAPMRLECVGGVTQDLARDDDVESPAQIARQVRACLRHAGVQ